MLVLACAFIALLGAVGAQSPFFGKCPDIKYQQNFDAGKYFTGKWYEQRRFFAVFEVGQKCVEAEYEVLPTGFVQVNNSGFITSKGQRGNQLGSAYCEKDEPAWCHVRFFANQPWGDYKVLSTDYDNYSVVYSCSSFLGTTFSVQFGWILTRQAQVGDALIEQANQLFKTNGIDPSGMEVVLQDCN